MSIGPAAITEILWTGTGLVGLVVTLWALHDAQADMRYLEALGLNGARQEVARGALVQEALRLLMLAIIVCIGLFAMSQPAANPDAPITATGVVLTAGLILLEFLIVAKTIHARWLRRRVIDMLIDRGQL